MSQWIERLFVWTGGGAFVASLGVTAWLYAVRFGRPDAPFDSHAIPFDLGLIALFGLHHSAFARRSVKEAMGRLLPSRLLRSVYVWVASLLLTGLCLWWRPVGGSVYQFAGLAAGPFLLVQATGVWLVSKAVRAIRALELAGIERPGAQPDELQITGPYRLVRHPLYLGWVLLVCATPHMTGDRLLFAVATAAYIAVAIPWEERDLTRDFGDRYRRYQGAVRWRLVPFVY
jgi:protein-S-isoprenylcysteine O-methyltransferase Ste14